MLCPSKNSGPARTVAGRSAARTIEVIQVIIEGGDEQPLAIGTAMPAEVRGVAGVAVPAKLFGYGRVAAAVLAEAVHDHHRRQRVAGGSQRR